jgi:hypothetical protein
MQPVSKQRLGKHAVYSAWSVPRSYVEDNWRFRAVRILYIVKDRPVLSTERAFHINKPAIVSQEKKTGLKSQGGA